MKLVNILLDIGTASPSVLDSVVGRDSASALETVRRTACTGAKDVLSEAPPVLLHPSKLPAANFLYSAEKPSPVEDGPYQHIGRDEVCAIRDGACIGGAIMDVCKGHSLPVILFATIGESGMEITCEMYGAPLAAMEAELYSSARPPTAFERRWLGAEAHGAKTLRRQVGNYVRKRGYDQMPTWMHENAFAAVRYGVLPFLRLRHADTTQEVEALTALMEHEVTPKGNGGLPSPTSPLKVLVDDMWQHDTPLRMKTVFYAMAHSEKPPPPSVGDVERNCRDPMFNSLLWPLALLILQHLEDPDYYGVEEDLGI